MKTKNEKLRELNERGALTRTKIDELIRKINAEKNPYQKRKLRSELEINKFQLAFLSRLIKHIRDFE